MFQIFRDGVVTEIITFSVQQTVIIAFMIYENKKVKKEHLEKSVDPSFLGSCW